MSDFPVLKTGAVAQYPAQKLRRFATQAVRFVDGSEQRFRDFPALLRRWVIQLDDLDETEMAAMRTFFREERGVAGTFAFTDPWDNITYPNCNLERDEMIEQFVDVGPNSADCKGGQKLMLYYPQLTTGAVSQYPVTRHNQRRTIVNVLTDGSDIREEDPGFASVAWDLSYLHLTASEVGAIEDLFEASEGQLGTFTFLDPTDNLLNWTEDFSHSNWTIGPLLTVTSGIADPFGGTSAARLTNIAQAVQSMSQAIAAPSGFQYCFSVWIRADVTSPVTLTAIGGGAQASRVFSAGQSWTRAIFPLILSNQADGIAFSVQLPPGNRADVFGPQVEAQLGAGGYKKASDLAGVYPHCRFIADELALTATGPNQYACKLTIMSCTAG